MGLFTPGGDADAIDTPVRAKEGRIHSVHLFEIEGALMKTPPHDGLACNSDTTAAGPARLDETRPMQEHPSHTPQTCAHPDNNQTINTRSRQNTA